MEAKKRKEEAEAAKVFEDFVASFEGDASSSRKKGGFVRGEVIQKGKEFERPARMDFCKGFDAEATGSSVLGSMACKIFGDEEKGGSTGKGVTETAIGTTSETPGKAAVGTGLSSLKTSSGLGSLKISKPASKKRSIDDLMSELKGGPSSRQRLDDSSCVGGGRGSGCYDVGIMGGSMTDQIEDRDTTNLYVGNLHPQVTEDVLMKEFGHYGPIASVKIMWPRSQEEIERQRNCGFVNMMERGDAERAMDAMKGRDFFGLEMRVGWGKAMPKSAVPCYVAPVKGETCRADNDRELPSYRRSGQVMVRFPKNEDVHALIDRMALYVSKHGHEFERAIINREKENPFFDFLWDPESRDGIYYKWKVYSLCQGDGMHEWRETPFHMFHGSERWLPPREEDRQRDCRDRPRSHSRDRDRDRDRGRDRERDRRRRSRSRSRTPPGCSNAETLTDDEIDDLQQMLRKLSAERQLIGDVMCWAIRRAEAAGEIVDLITQSLTLIQTPITTKLARLFLVSDILHNSSAGVKKASLYRSSFEKCLPKIFKSFGDKLRSQDIGRITAEAMKDKVLRVLRVWEVWSIYPQDMLNRLEETFTGIEVAGPVPREDVDGEPLVVPAGLDGNALAGDAFHGEDQDGEDLDGEALDGEDLDGMPLESVGKDDVDGEALASDEDDGGCNPALPISKWNRPPGT